MLAVVELVHSMPKQGVRSTFTFGVAYGMARGTIAALQVLTQLVASGKPASEVLHLFDPVPQLLKNVRFSGGKPLDNANVQTVIAKAEAELAGNGRLVIRPSGTEPVIRVMAEGDDAVQVERIVDSICDAVRAAAS
jgi:phosphoglucosamine mutase